MKLTPDQKKLVLREIQSWRESRILPAEYCDFLMNLYNEGESFSGDQKHGNGKQGQGMGRNGRGPLPSLGTSAGHTSTGASAGTREGRSPFPFGRILLVVGFLLLFVIFGFNFTLFPQPMQIGVLVFGVVVAYVLAFRSRHDEPTKRVTWLSIASFLVAASGYFYLSINGLLEDRSALIQVMSVVFFLWILTGSVGRSRLITGLGLAGELLMFATLLETVFEIGNSPYGVQHFYWLIPALAYLFFAFQLGRFRVYVAPAFLFVGLLGILGPDIRMLVFGVPMDFFIQVIIFLKLAVLVSLFIAFGAQVKKWSGHLSA